MVSASSPALTRAQKLWALAAFVPFLASLFLLGTAIASSKLLLLGAGWPALQIFGYGGALSRARGDPAHPLFVSQVMIHCTALTLIIALLFA